MTEFVRSGSGLVVADELRVDWLDWCLSRRWAVELSRTGDGDYVADLLDGHRKALARGVGKTVRDALDGCQLAWESIS